MATPKTITIRFRATPEFKAELEQRAKLENVPVSDWIRQRLKIDADGPPGSAKPGGKATSATVEEIRGQMVDPDQAVLHGRIAKHKLRMPLPAAERLARKELQE